MVVWVKTNRVSPIPFSLPYPPGRRLIVAFGELALKSKMNIVEMRAIALGMLKDVLLGHYISIGHGEYTSVIPAANRTSAARIVITASPR